MSDVTTARLVFTTTGLTQADGYFSYGHVEWTTGDNADLTSEIKDYTLSGNILELQLRTPYAIEAGDEFTICPGCDKTAETCQDRFGNIAQFGGFPFIPGTDIVLRNHTIRG